MPLVNLTELRKEQQRIRDLVAQDRAHAALKQLLKLTESGGRWQYLHHRVILQQNALARYENQDRNGTLPPGSDYIYRQITEAILKITDQLGRPPTLLEKADGFLLRLWKGRYLRLAVLATTILASASGGAWYYHLTQQQNQFILHGRVTARVQPDSSIPGARVFIDDVLVATTDENGIYRAEIARKSKQLQAPYAVRASHPDFVEEEVYQPFEAHDNQQDLQMRSLPPK